MSVKKHFVLVTLVAVVMLSTSVAPALGQNGTNLICESSSERTGLGNLVNTVSTLIVTLAALIAVVGGAAYTMASAAQPEKEKYIKGRNRSVLYGGGTIVVMYGANELVSQLDSSLEFGCILPGSV